ncbi:MAG: pilus assembly protein PilY, partial [Candidatus Saccharibacteria bacterium]|nr:pilus assembly protein PilY [Moraxellaceae bacterium]
GAIKRVMIVGGGYDVCYESPLFALNSTSTNLKSGCSSKTKAAGNAVYMVDATTGDLIWEATDAAASIVGGLPSTARATYNTDLVHSVVMRISTLDRNADGLIDHLYFGDLGGQIFRADFDNASQRTASNQGRFGVRVVRLADLRNTTTPANSPRFYVAPTVTIHDEGANTFIMLGIGSGDRSSPLDVLPLADGGKNPIVAGGAAVTKPVNNVYGIIDRDFINTQLISVPAVPPSTTTTVLANTSLVSKDIRLSSLQINPQLLSTSTKNIPDYFFGTGKKEGWYRSLSSQSTGVELTGRTAGGMKAFEEEALAITGTLFMPVYDPQGVATPQASQCSAKVIGETIRERFCIPYGACLNSDGTVNSTLEQNTGLVINTLTDHPTLMGNGIRGIAFGKKDGGGLTILGNTSGTGGWSTNRKLVPTRWYEKQPNPNKVQ